MTDDQILAIGRRALDKCTGTDAQHIYIGREVERSLAASAPRVELVGYLPAYELDRVRSGHDGRLRSAKFGPSELDGDIPVYAGIPSPSAADQEREQLRVAQAAAVMPLIGPLLDAWEGVPNDIKSGFDMDALRRQFRALSRAMETAEIPASSVEVPQQATVNDLVALFRGEAGAHLTRGQACDHADLLLDRFNITPKGPIGG